MWPFGSKNSGNKVKVFGQWLKCNDCGHNRHLDVKHRPGDRFDRVRAKCAKCGSSTGDDGPFHDSNPRLSRSVEIH